MFGSIPSAYKTRRFGTFKTICVCKRGEKYIQSMFCVGKCEYGLCVRVKVCACVDVCVYIRICVGRYMFLCVLTFYVHKVLL